MWDFKSENTKTHTHGFHTYPAMMIPQIAKKLITDYGTNAQLLFDPYCGTGTSLVEANLAGINAVGSDLNPLARLLAKVKTTPIEIQTLKFHLHDFDQYLFRFRFGFDGADSIIAPSFPRIDFWFSKDVKQKLAVIKKYVDRIENNDISDFFKVALSQTIRDTSWTRNNEFKLYKMSSEQIKNFSPDPYGRMEFVLGRNFKSLIEFIEGRKNDSVSKVLNVNTIRSVRKNKVFNTGVDMVVTSPPYGDSATTVAYGQFSTLANQWLGFMENGRTLDKDLMGGQRAVRLKKFKSEALNENISEISKVDSKRVLDVVSFFSDYEKSIKNVSQLVNPGGISCYVVSNRNVRGTTVLTDQITKDFFENYGFEHIDTFTRKISGKRMPRQNSPTGNVGKKVSLMNKEFIVVMQKN
ncbi:DNA methyltransferase [bacterium SCSIO 12643]|nr:DNA methyltransferase [bacterium SCSIO 12643]